MYRVALLLTAHASALLLTPCMVHAVSYRLTQQTQVNENMTDANLPSLLGSSESCGVSLDFPFSVNRPKSEPPSCGKGNNCLKNATAVSRHEAFTGSSAQHSIDVLPTELETDIADHYENAFTYVHSPPHAPPLFVASSVVLRE